MNLHDASGQRAEEASEQCHYYNTGCWTDHHCHYLTVQGGCFSLREASADAPTNLEPAFLDEVVNV